MALNLQQVPNRYRKVLYRSDHFWVNTHSSAILPRYSATAYSTANDKLEASNEEATLSLSLDGSTPFRDVYVGSADTNVYYNGVAYLVDKSAAGNMVVAAGDSSSATVTDYPIWYSNCLEKATTKYNAYKTLWHPGYRPGVDAKEQCSEMREAIGLSAAMKYYNKVSVYRKKFRITFTPRQCNRIRAYTTATPLHGFAIAGANATDNYDSPLQCRPYGASFCYPFNAYGDPDETMVAGAFESTEPQRTDMVPFWVNGQRYPLPIKQSKEGMKIGLFEHLWEKRKSIVIEYTVSMSSVYGQKFDMSEHYYYIDGGVWTAVNPHPTFVNFFLYTLQNSRDANSIPKIEGHCRIESWSDCLFWDRKSVNVSFGLSTEPAGTAAIAIDDDEEELELEAAD